jgi:hypothetical protein
LSRAPHSPVDGNGSAVISRGGTLDIHFAGFAQKSMTTAAAVVWVGLLECLQNSLNLMEQVDFAPFIILLTFIGLTLVLGWLVVSHL